MGRCGSWGGETVVFHRKLRRLSGCRRMEDDRPRDERQAAKASSCRLQSEYFLATHTKTKRSRRGSYEGFPVNHRWKSLICLAMRMLCRGKNWSHGSSSRLNPAMRSYF